MRNFYLITLVVVSPDGSCIISGDVLGTIQLEDIHFKNYPWFRKGSHGGGVKSLAISLDGGTLISGGGEGFIYVWNFKSHSSEGVELNWQALFFGHQGSVNSVAISPDGKTVVSGGDDGTVRLWDIEEVTTEDPDDLLRIACNRLRHHPRMLHPETEEEIKACEICQKYVWQHEVAEPADSSP
jgi:WD40 repeat protein